MHNISFLLLGLLAWLVAGAVANIPHTLYRGDTRAPAAIKAAGGFKSKGATHKLGPDGTVIQHVEGTLKYPSRDPYISTSSDLAEARKKAGSKGFVYTIDTTGITDTFVDVAAEYAKLQKKYGHSDEKEFAAHLFIPWAHIVAAQEAKSGKAVSLTRRDVVEAVAEWEDELSWEVERGEGDDDSVPDWDNVHEVYGRDDGNNVQVRDGLNNLDKTDVARDETPVVRRVAKPLRV